MGGGEKVPEGAATCLSSKQEGSGCEAGEAGPLCWWEGAPVMVTPKWPLSEMTSWGTTLTHTHTHTHTHTRTHPEFFCLHGTLSL